MGDTKETRSFNFRGSFLSLISLSVYRELLSDTIINRFYGLLKYISGSEASLEGFIDNYCSFYNEFIKYKTKGSLKDYIIEKIIYSENPFTKACENYNFCDLDKDLIDAASRDLEKLRQLSDITSDEIRAYAAENFCKAEFEMKLVGNLPKWDSGVEYASAEVDFGSLKSLILSGSSRKKCIEEIARFHNRNGTGMFIKYKAFVWDASDSNGSLRGVDNPDPVTLADLIGYESEREEVISNTQKFLKGYCSNNVLLYGDRGTGKSSTVKAILNEYCGQGLRIVELPKAHLADFPKIIRSLTGRKQKFIIFVDDLAFEDNEENYTALKAVLEGGVENRPRNVLIYATSNRRHLIKEKFSDRLGLQSGDAEDEIRSADTIQEKLSLADRFGITVVFSSPDKSRYLKIVEGIAQKRGITMGREQLHKEALKWELWYNGRSPRTARQFIDWLEGQ